VDGCGTRGPKNLSVKKRWKLGELQNRRRGEGGRVGTAEPFRNVRREGSLGEFRLRGAVGEEKSYPRPRGEPDGLTRSRETARIVKQEGFFSGFISLKKQARGSSLGAWGHCLRGG